MPGERLSRYLARSGVASRRKSEEIVRSGRVKVNNATITDPAYPIFGDGDRVTVDGAPVKPSRRYYIALNKPAGYLSDLSDPRRRKLARDLIDIDASLFPVGRLDYNSEGLILFTNDGDFAFRLSHPRHQVEKEYVVKVSGILSDAERSRMTEGITIGPDSLSVKSITLIKTTGQNSWYNVVATEGKNRMIRRMAEAISHPVLRLRRIRIGEIRLGDLKPGQYRVLHRATIQPYLATPAPPRRL